MQPQVALETAYVENSAINVIVLFFIEGNANFPGYCRGGSQRGYNVPSHSTHTQHDRHFPADLHKTAGRTLQLILIHTGSDGVVRFC